MSTQEILQTEEAIAYVKLHFAKYLRKALNLFPISSPMIVEEGTGINDDLNGIECPVSFPVKLLGNNQAVVVHSLAKWKRIRLMELNLAPGSGILTDMRALRPEEDSSPIHSIYVDQWDWEKVIKEEDKQLSYLKETVNAIYRALLKTNKKVQSKYAAGINLPKHVHFIHAQELLQLYPNANTKQRENEIAKQYGAVFIIGIGYPLSHGLPHDSRSSDYDDWSTINEDGFFGLNGDLLVWNDTLGYAIELSSMGIRVDQKALTQQLALSKSEGKEKLLYHQLLLNGKLPLTIGGGLGQSRICMLLLQKEHIGQVQASIWPSKVRNEQAAKGIYLL